MNAIEITFFEILKIKNIIKSNIHEIDLIFIFHFYINVFEFAIKLIITQFQFFI